MRIERRRLGRIDDDFRSRVSIGHEDNSRSIFPAKARVPPQKSSGLCLVFRSPPPPFVGSIAARDDREEQTESGSQALGTRCSAKSRPQNFDVLL
jgi:hypothetical protein